MRRDMMDVLALFRGKGYVCGYLTTNGVLIDEARASALADLAATGFLRHVSVSIDGPGPVHDHARGVAGTFERAASGLRRLREAAARKRAPLRVSINTTVTRESLNTLDRMVDVAGELGVDAIGLNHLMFATTAEVAETARLLGTTEVAAISTFVTDEPGVTADEVRSRVEALERACRQRRVRFDVRPKVTASLMQPYYTPGTPLDGRCLYPFLNARVSSSGKAFFCPFIRVEVGDLLTEPLRRNLERGSVRRSPPAPPAEPCVPRLPPLLQGGAFGGRRLTVDCRLPTVDWCAGSGSARRPPPHPQRPADSRGWRLRQRRVAQRRNPKAPWRRRPRTSRGGWSRRRSARENAPAGDGPCSRR